MSRVELGDLGKDLITGFEGVVFVIIEYKYNSPRVCLRSRTLSADGKMIENYFDICTIEVVEKGIVPCVAPGISNSFKYGDIVKDKHSVFKGTVIAFAYWLTGCTRVGIQSAQLTKDGSPADDIYLAVDQLSLVKRCSEEGTEEEGDDPPGGPMDNPTYVSHDRGW